MNQRIEGLDSIRFLAALWVAISHGALPLKTLASEPILKNVLSALTSSFSGMAAVMVFFIVSGLCIHWPYATGRTVPVLTFLIRRYVRIGVPLLAILLIAHGFGARSTEGLEAVIWSVEAELLYYSIYPIVFVFVKRFGWLTVIGCSLALPVSVIIGSWGTDFLSSLGWMSAIWGLPIWLSGCLLAHFIQNPTSLRVHFPGGVWMWRAIAWGVSVASQYFLFHSPIKISSLISMLVFSAMAWVWLLKELQRPVRAWSVLERCGAASYSLYLVHYPILCGMSDYIPSISPIADLVIRAALITLATVMMYGLVEAPSHRLARKVAAIVPRPSPQSSPISATIAR